MTTKPIYGDGDGNDDWIKRVGKDIPTPTARPPATVRAAGEIVVVESDDD